MNGIPVSLSRDELLDCIVAFKEGREIPVPPDGWSTQKLLEVAGAANFVAMLQVRGELQQEIGDLADNEQTKQDAAWNAAIGYVSVCAKYAEGGWEQYFEPQHTAVFYDDRIELGDGWHDSEAFFERNWQAD